MNNLKKIGIIGGGQLARMLCIQAHKLGLEVHILSDNSDDPAALVTNKWHKGSIMNKKAIQNFSKNVDIITFESEFADTQIMKTVKAKYLPSLKCISLLQDRLSQKKSLVKFKLPTSPFIHTDNDLLIQQFYQKYKGFVAKKRLFGYDGYGTVIVKNKSQLNNFLKLNNKLEYIIEQFIPFQKELSIVCALTAKKQFTCYPLVETVQQNAKCFSVKGPVKQTKINSLKKKIKIYLNDINYTGVIAFELFDFNGNLIINEVAPRVHNSGHHTLDSFNIDQFSLHLHCILGHTLPKLKPKSKGYAMVNLIGSNTKKPHLHLCSHSQLHWYCKNENRPGRKMGHINSISDSPTKALKLALKDSKGFRL